MTAGDGAHDPHGPGDADDEFATVSFDEDFVNRGRPEASADERIAHAQRIAGANDRLRAAGEIADGSGIPGPRRHSRPVVWIAAGLAILLLGTAIAAAVL